MKFFTAKSTFGTKSNIKNIPWFLASHAFVVVLVLILVDLLLGIMLFYQYVILTKAPLQDAASQTVQFEYTTYQAAVKQMQATQQKVKNPFEPILSNPFAPN